MHLATNYDKLSLPQTANLLTLSREKSFFMPQIKPKARKSDIVIQEFGNETLVYDLSSNKAFNLNETSTIIWQLSDGSKTISEIADAVSKNFNSLVSVEFVWLALEQLRKEDLIENEVEIANLFEGVSRRAMIRQVGLSSMIAFPIITSLIAPLAVNAQSGFCGGSCQCPNATVNFCSPAAGGGTTNCNLLNPTATCRCRSPFGAPGSGTSPGQKVGNCATA